MNCIECSATLTGRRTVYCSTLCRRSSENRKYQSYQAQQARGLARKLEYVLERGGCERCGYADNLAALDFHHKSPSTKTFNMDMRNLSNRTKTACDMEFAKCQILCKNCHAAEHNPTLSALYGDNQTRIWDSPIFQQKLRELEGPRRRFDSS